MAHLRTWKTLAIFPIALILFLIISFRAAISLGSSTAGEGRGGEGRGEEGEVEGSDNVLYLVKATLHILTTA